MSSHGLFRSIFCLLFSPFVCGSEIQEDTVASYSPSAGWKEEAVRAIMAYDGDEEHFSRLIMAARRLNIPEQTLREARLFYYLGSQDEQGLASLADEFAAQAESFKEKDSELYSRKQDWLAAVSFLQAIKKRLAGDVAGFEQGIKNAFWLSPRQSALFSPFVYKHHVREVLDREKISDSFALSSITGESGNFSQWKADHKGVIFHFISLWNKECAEAMPDFLEAKKELSLHGFKVITVIVQSPEKIKMELPNYLLRTKLPPDDLYYDLPENSLAGRLCVEKLPSMALVSSSGKVLFSGRPNESEFWEKLHKLSPSLKRPLLEPARHPLPTLYESIE